MHLARLCCLIAAALPMPLMAADAALATGAHGTGGSEATVDLGASTQVQSGRQNQQSARIGNVAGNGSTRVHVQRLLQEQAGSGNRQTLLLGNVSGGGRVDVTTGPLRQQQSGITNTQSATMANSTGGARIGLRLGGLQQSQTGQHNLQSLELANATGGDTRVQVDRIVMQQDGSQGTQQVRIGNNAGRGALDLQVGPVIQLGPGRINIGNVDHAAP